MRAWDALLFLLCLAVSLIVFAIFKLTVGVDQSWLTGIVGAAVLAAIITVVSYLMSRNDGREDDARHPDAGSTDESVSPEPAPGSSENSGTSER